MNIDITSMFFNSKIEGETATAAWGTSLGQSKARGYRINSDPGIVDMLFGMSYKSVSHIGKLDVSKGSSNREVLICSVFDNVYINNIKLDNAQFTLLLVKEHTPTHDGRLLISYAPYIKYNGVENQLCIDQMQEKLGCTSEGCWLVYDITIKNQSDLYFSAIVLDPTASVIYKGIKSRDRSAMWKDKVAELTKEQKPSPIDTTPIIKSIKETGLIYSDSIIKRLTASLIAKPFVILSGLAGSGKTQLAVAFAKCLCENINEQLCVVSVGADWTNREPLLGYPNALNKKEYVKPESGALQLLMRANEHKNRPYFLILDEMNLSVVERYFADFLSAMESGESIKLWDGNDTADEDDYVPAEISLPKNVFIIGTINVDETTYMFSPKVLDRANVIEFKISVDEMKQFVTAKKDIHPEKAYSICSNMAEDFVGNAKSQFEIKNENNAMDVLISFFENLKQVNAEFGYRTINEIGRYLHFAEQDKMLPDDAIDTVILQKLLPKLHGSRKKLVPVLTAMWNLCLAKNKSAQIETNKGDIVFKYKESAEKIKRMYDAVVDNGFTSFAEA